MTARAAGWPPGSLTMLGDRNNFDRIGKVGELALRDCLVPIQNIQGDNCVQLQVGPVVALSSMHT